MHHTVPAAEKNTKCIRLFMEQKKTHCVWHCSWHRKVYHTVHKADGRNPFPHMGGKKSLFKKKIVNTDYYIARNANTEYDMVR